MSWLLSLVFVILRREKKKEQRKRICMLSPFVLLFFVRNPIIYLSFSKAIINMLWTKERATVRSDKVITLGPTLANKLCPFFFFFFFPFPLFFFSLQFALLFPFFLFLCWRLLLFLKSKFHNFFSVFNKAKINLF